MPHSTEQPVDLSELGTGTGPSTTLSRGSGGKRTHPEPRRLRLSDTCFSLKDGSMPPANLLVPMALSCRCWIIQLELDDPSKTTKQATHTNFNSLEGAGATARPVVGSPNQRRRFPSPSCPRPVSSWPKFRVAQPPNVRSRVLEHRLSGDFLDAHCSGPGHAYSFFSHVPGSRPAGISHNAGGGPLIL